MVAPPVQKNAANLNHCARFVFLSRAIDESNSPSDTGGQASRLWVPPHPRIPTPLAAMLPPIDFLYSCHSTPIGWSWWPHSFCRSSRCLLRCSWSVMSSAAPPAAAIAASALALPICQSSAAPAAPAAAQSTGLGGRIPAAAATSEDPAISSVSTSYSAPSKSASAASPCVVGPGDAAAPAAVGKPSRFIASPAVASAAGRDDRACYLLLPS